MGREVEIDRRIEVGEGSHRYHVVEDWPQLPEGVTVEEVVAVACDSEGRAYVFNRGSHPLMIFDRTGRFIDSFEAGPFARPHGITIGPDNTVYCVDDFDHTVKVFSRDGRSLWTLGKSRHVPCGSLRACRIRTVRTAQLPQRNGQLLLGRD